MLAVQAAEVNAQTMLQSRMSAVGSFTCDTPWTFKIGQQL